MPKFWNNQKYHECQLISIWNAGIYYNQTVPLRYGKEYIEDCERGCTIHGSCINSNHVIHKMHLKPIKGILSWNWIKRNRKYPVEYSLFCHRGYHSVLAIKVDIKKKKVLLANYAKDRLYWLSVDRLIKLHNKHVVPIKWVLQKERTKIIDYWHIFKCEIKELKLSRFFPGKMIKEVVK